MPRAGDSARYCPGFPLVAGVKERAEVRGSIREVLIMTVHEGDRRPPTYDEALELYRRGRELVDAVQVKIVGDGHVLGSDVLTQVDRDMLLRAHVLLSGAHAAASLRLIAPVNVVAGMTDTAQLVR